MADVSVRPARAGDAAEVGRIQLATWRVAYAALLPAAVLDGLSDADAAAAWQDAIDAPPSAQHHVLVATEGDALVGFVAVAPGGDEDDPADGAATIGPLLVEPRWGRRGHGSRLLAAAVEYAGRDGATRLVAWVPEEDGASRTFFGDAGWAADGYARTLDTGGGELREIRLHTSLTDAPA